MAINCETVANEELKRLRNIEKLLSALVLAIGGQSLLTSLNLEV